MLSSFKSVHLVVCENFVSPGLLKKKCQKYCHSKNHNICTYFSVDLAVQGYPPPPEKEKRKKLEQN